MWVRRRRYQGVSTTVDVESVILEDPNFGLPGVADSTFSQGGEIIVIPPEKPFYVAVLLFRRLISFSSR